MIGITRMPNGLYKSPLCKDSCFLSEHAAHARHARLMHEFWIRAYAGTDEQAEVFGVFVETYERMRSETRASNEIDAAPIDVHRSQVFSEELGGYFGTTPPASESVADPTPP